MRKAPLALLALLVACGYEDENLDAPSTAEEAVSPDDPTDDDGMGTIPDLGEAAAPDPDELPDPDTAPSREDEPRVLAASMLPVVPGLKGFGANTRAGRGGAVYRVTNLAAKGAGSLRACIDAVGPRTCIFEVSGTIALTSNLVVRNPYLTIAGQTAPSPGILVRGGAIVIVAHDVLLQHVHVRAGDVSTKPRTRRAGVPSFSWMVRVAGESVMALARRGRARCGGARPERESAPGYARGAPPGW